MNDTTSFLTKPLLQLCDLSLMITDKKLLNSLNLSLHQGDCLAIIGPSGAGKTTLLQLLAGICPGKIKGQLYRFGVAADPTPNSRIGLLPQGLSDNLNPHMTVAQHLEDGLALYTTMNRRERRSNIEKRLQQVALSKHLLNRYPRHLSGGEIQRVLLALATLNDPDILLLDEPTAALDPQTREQIIFQLQQQNQHKTIVVVTHDMSLVRQLANRVIVMEQGNIISTKKVTQSWLSAESESLLSDLKEKRTSTNRECLLSLENLHLNHHNRTIFNGFKMQLKRSSITLVYGASGSGKSTLARLLAGWDPFPKEAKLRCNGRRVMLSQHPRTACAEYFSLRQILVEPLMLNHQMVKLDQIRDWLRIVQLPDTDTFLKRKPTSLSGGELQRLLLVRAMLTEPDLLIADEPTSALDPALRNEIIIKLIEIQKRSGCAMLIFTHDPEICRLTGITGKRLTSCELRDSLD